MATKKIVTQYRRIKYLYWGKPLVGHFVNDGIFLLTLSNVYYFSTHSCFRGDLAMAWVIENPPPLTDPDFEVGQRGSIEVTLTAKESMEGAGFLGIGWRARRMNGADLWFCRVDPTEHGQFPRPFPNSCDARQTTPAMFSCCVARGANVVPSCIDPNDSAFYELEVVSWCLSTGSALVTVQAPVCDDGEGDNAARNCFKLSSNADGTIDVIAAFNPSAQNRPHGFRRRTSTVVDLKNGILTAAEASVADNGLIAFHAVTMMTFWMVLAPIGIFIARFMKTRTWRLVAHISIMVRIPLLHVVTFSRQKKLIMHDVLCSTGCCGRVDDSYSNWSRICCWCH
jgi:hypothetical protein